MKPVTDMPPTLVNAPEVTFFSSVATADLGRVTCHFKTTEYCRNSECDAWIGKTSLSLNNKTPRCHRLMHARI